MIFSGFPVKTIVLLRMFNWASFFLNDQRYVFEGTPYEAAWGDYMLPTTHLLRSKLKILKIHRVLEIQMLSFQLQAWDM